jgi:hypothetical protein
MLSFVGARCYPRSRPSDGPIDPILALPFASATEGMPQKAAEGATEALRHNQTFLLFGSIFAKAGYEHSVF